MEFHQVVKEFQEISAALERQRKLNVLRRILKLMVIGFFIGRGSNRRILELNKKRQLIIKNINGHCTHALKLARKCVEEIQNSGTYLIHADKELCVAAMGTLEADLSYLDENKVLEPEFVFSTKGELERLRQIILNYNRKFIEKRKKDYGYLWKKGLLSLDEEQQESIITDDRHNLVVAVAGSGKTRTRATVFAFNGPLIKTPSMPFADAESSSFIWNILDAMYSPICPFRAGLPMIFDISWSICLLFSSNSAIFSSPSIVKHSLLFSSVHCILLFPFFI